MEQFAWIISKFKSAALCSISSLFNLLVIILVFPNPVLAQDFTRVLTGPVVNDLSQSYGSSFFDYDNDGDIDLYVANFSNTNNLFFENDGNGNFVQVNNSLTSFTGSSLGHSWVDFDLDCDNDLYISNGGVDGLQTNHLLENNSGVFSLTATAPITTDNGDSQTSNWGDYDNDGDLDLFVANLGGQNNFLYRNDGGGNFTSITTGPISNSAGGSNDANWVDYDGDGDLDLFVANQPNQNNFLFRNDNGVFVQILIGDIVNDGGSSFGSVWGDYDNDGDLDLYVCNRHQANFLYRNDGNGTFTRILSGDMVTDAHGSYGASWIDYNNDGHLDLFVANNGGQNNDLYLNNGNSTFTTITSGDIVNNGGDSRSCNWADIDNDGDLDCYVTNKGPANNFLYRNEIGSLNSWTNITLVSSVSNTNCIGVIVRAKAIINGQPIWQMREVSSKAGYCAQESPNIEFGFGNATVIDSIIVEWPTSGTTCYYTHVLTNQFITYGEECGAQPEPLTFLDTICGGQSIVLEPDSDIYYWYADSMDTQPSFIGASIDLGILQNDTVLYFRNPNWICSSELNVYYVHVNGVPGGFNIGSDTSLCKDQTITLYSNVVAGNITWSNGSTASSVVVDESGTYSATFELGSCSYSDTVNVSMIFPVDFSFPSDTAACGSLLLDTEYPGYEILWSTGETEHQIEITRSGTYSLTIYGPCETTTLEIEVIIESQPIAAFTSRSKPVEFIDPNVQFVNESIGASAFEWHFGDGDLSYEKNPKHTYDTAGIVLVMLVASNSSELGCADTAYGYIEIDPYFTFYVPNAFTPDGDGVNDSWGALGLNFEYESFELEVFDRWGGLIWRTDNPLKFWNGNHGTSGERVKQGVYVYQFRLRKFNTFKPKVLKGIVTLYRHN